MSRVNLAATAQHEAGHAIAAFFFAHKVTTVTIKPGPGTLGHCVSSPVYGRGFRPDLAASPRGFLQLCEAAVVCLAGHEAEREFTGRNDYRSSRGDRQKAAELVSYLAGSSAEADALLRWCRVRARLVVQNRKPQINALAAALLARTTLTAAEVRAVVSAVRRPVAEK